MTGCETIDRYCNYLTLMGRSPLTVSQYETDLQMFMKFILCKRSGARVTTERIDETSIEGVGLSVIGSVTSSEIYDFLRYVTEQRGNKSSARARKLSSIRSFYKYLVNTANLLDKNPAEGISTPSIPKRLPKYLTVDESLDLISAVTDDNSSKTVPRDYAMVVVFLNTGIRLSELVGINLGDLDKELQSMRVIGKGNKERIVYLNSACRDAIMIYLEYRSAMTNIRDKNALFLSLRGDRISKKTVQYVIKKYLKLSGLEYKHFSTHKLRHTAATLMYQSGKVDVRVLKDILGHEQLNTTQIYTHTSNAQMENAMDNNPLSGIKGSRRIKKKKPPQNTDTESENDDTSSNDE